MYMNTPNHIINLEKYEETLKESIQTILRKIGNIFNNTQEYSIENQGCLNKEYLELEKDINNRMSNILEFLKENHILKSEYYDFMEIQSLLNQALENKNMHEMEIVLKILKAFEKITELKFDLLQKDLLNYNEDFKGDEIFNNVSQNLKKEFEEKYEKFSSFFLKCQMEFHTLEGKTKHESAKKYLNLLEREYIK